MVTILFTDIVGSTELSTSLDPEPAEELRQTHFGLLRKTLIAAGSVDSEEQTVRSHVRPTK